MNGPTNIAQLADLFASRSFPADLPGAEPRSHQVQGPSDRMREKASDFARILFGLVPETEFQQYASLVLYDLCIMGEQKLCKLRGVETEHAALRVLGPAEAKPSPKPAKGK
jgi:hypothetical protein